MADPIDVPKTYTQDEFDAQLAERMETGAGALKRALDAERDEKKEAKAATRILEAKFAELEQTAKAAKVGINSAELERLRQEVKLDLDKTYQPVTERAALLEAENRRMKLDRVVKSEMAKSGARADRIEALFKLTAGEYDLTEDGKPMLKERPGTPVEKYVSEELKALYPEFYEGSGSSGGGATKSHASSGGARIIPDGATWSKADIEDIASGKAQVR